MKIKKKLTAALLTAGLSLSLLFQSSVYAEQDKSTNEITTNAIANWPQGPEISSTAAVIMDAESNTLLYAKNKDQQLYPSAAVKIMTCLLALENGNLSDEVTMTATGVSGVTDGGANISSQLDEVFTLEQCLYAIMVASANDLTLQVAEHIGGSVDEFVNMMNARAKELGCTNTVFTNPTGLPDEKQHTTAQDMALIMKEAIQNETFRVIASTSAYTIPATNVSGGSRALTSNFPMINNLSESYYQGCIGGKEGYTVASGSTLVYAAEREDLTLICVVLHGLPENTDAEAISLLNYGFENFKKIELDDSDFNIISGGYALLPSTASESDLEIQDTETAETIERDYLFSGIKMGSAVLENIQIIEETNVIDGEGNLQEAKAFSEAHTEKPYYIIAGIGAFILLMLLILMIRVIRS